MFQTIHKTWEEVVSMHKLSVCVSVRSSAAWWGRWMMDARQESYATAPSAPMASGRYTPAPNADLVAEDDTAILHSHFFALSIPIFSPSLTMGTAGSIAPYPRWLCVVLNKAFCSRRAHCIESCTSYRWGTDGLLSGWSCGFKRCAHIQRDEKGLLVVPGNEDVTLIHLHVVIGVNLHWPLLRIHLPTILDPAQCFVSSIIYITVHGYFISSSFNQSD